MLHSNNSGKPHQSQSQAHWGTFEASQYAVPLVSDSSTRMVPAGCSAATAWHRAAAVSGPAHMRAPAAAAAAAAARQLRSTAAAWHLSAAVSCRAGTQQQQQKQHSQQHVQKHESSASTSGTQAPATYTSLHSSAAACNSSSRV
jgi:hypothetical protein